MRRTLPRLALAAVSAAALSAGLAACGEKSDDVGPGGKADDVTLMLDFVPNADHVGLYRAQGEGDFRAAALNVRLQPPPTAASPLALLQQGKADFAISYEPELLLARDKGQALVAVAAIVQRPLTSLISLPGAHIGSPADLKGKTVGTAGIPYQAAYLRTILRGANVPASSVKTRNIGFNLNQPLIAKRVDATLGGYWNYEGLQLQQEKRKPVIVPVDRLGVPTYDELVLVARRDTLAKKGDLVRRLVQAIGRGYASVTKDPEAGVNDLVRLAPGLDKKLQTASVNATLGSFQAPAGKPFGWMQLSQWSAYGRWMKGQGLIKNARQAQDAFTTEFLAGQGA